MATFFVWILQNDNATSKVLYVCSRETAVGWQLFRMFTGPLWKGNVLCSIWISVSFMNPEHLFCYGLGTFIQYGRVSVMD